MRRFLATLTLICLLAAIEMIDSQAQPQPGSSTNNHKDELKSLIELGNTQREGEQWAACVETYGKAIAVLAKATRDDFAIFFFRGICSQRQGKWPDAEADFKKALELYPDQPLVLNQLGFNWVDQGVHLDEALRMLRRAAEQRRDNGSILDSLGWANYRLGNFQEAARYLEQAIKLLPANPDVAKHLGDTYAKLGRTNEAENLRSAVQNRIAAGELNKKVIELYRAGRYAEAIPLAQQALAIREKALGPDDPDVATALNNLAFLYNKQGRYAEAEPLYKRAVAIQEKALGPDHPDVAAALTNLAVFYGNQRRDADAEPLLKRVLAIREKALGPDHPDVANALDNLATCYDNQRRYAEARPLYQRSLAIYEKALGPDAPLVGAELESLAADYLREDLLADAEALLKRVLAIREKALGPDHPDVAAALTNLAALYDNQGRYAEAEPLYQRSLAIYEKVFGLDHPHVAAALSGLAGLYLHQGRYAEAEPLYKRAVAIQEKALGPDHPDVAMDLNSLAALYDQQGRYAEAEPLYQRSLAIYEKVFGLDHPHVAGVLNNLAQLYRQQYRYSEALPLIRRTIVQKSVETWEALPVLFGAQAEKLIGADEAFDHSLNVVQRASQTSAGQAVNALAVRFSTGNLQLAQLVRRDQDLAGEAASLDKAIIAAVSNEPSKRDVAAEQRVKDRIAAVTKERDDLQTVFRNEFPDFAALSNPPPLTVKDIHALLGDDEALIIINLVDHSDKSYVWVITRSAAEWKELGVNASQAAKLVATLRSQLNVKNLLPFDPKPSFELYRQLLGPVEDTIAAKARLSIVVNGALSSLPPQVLVTRDPAGKALKDVDWLVRTHAITVLPSVASLQVLRGKSAVANAAKPLIGFANPVFDRDQQQLQNVRVAANVAAARGIRGTVADIAELRTALPPLPETAGELKKVAASVHGDPSDLFIGADATETRVKQEKLDQFRIVYFATHGLLAGDVADFAKLNAEPALVLSLPDHPTELDDGLLTASEVAQLKLNADWVILSACNTASADKPGAEALSGLARAFFYAGARSLVVSNWEVDSDSAVALMTGTFAALAANPTLSHAEALQKSILAMIDNPQQPEWANPKYWAPFIVVGEPAKPAN